MALWPLTENLIQQQIGVTQALIGGYQAQIPPLQQQITNLQADITNQTGILNDYQAALARLLADGP